MTDVDHSLRNFAVVGWCRKFRWDKFHWDKFRWDRQSGQMFLVFVDVDVGGISGVGLHFRAHVVYCEVQFFPALLNSLEIQSVV